MYLTIFSNCRSCACSPAATCCAACPAPLLLTVSCMAGIKTELRTAADSEALCPPPGGGGAGWCCWETPLAGVPPALLLGVSPAALPGSTCREGLRLPCSCPRPPCSGVSCAEGSSWPGADAPADRRDWMVPYLWAEVMMHGHGHTM